MMCLFVESINTGSLKKFQTIFIKFHPGMGLRISKRKNFDSITFMGTGIKNIDVMIGFLILIES